MGFIMMFSSTYVIIGDTHWLCALDTAVLYPLTSPFLLK